MFEISDPPDQVDQVMGKYFECRWDQGSTSLPVEEAIGLLGSMMGISSQYVYIETNLVNHTGKSHICRANSHLLLSSKHVRKFLQSNGAAYVYVSASC